MAILRKLVIPSIPEIFNVPNLIDIPNIPNIPSIPDMFNNIFIRKNWNFWNTKNSKYSDSS